jgi:hypothetical protein
MVMCHRQSSGEPNPPVTRCGEVGGSRRVLLASVMALAPPLFLSRSVSVLSAVVGVSTRAASIPSARRHGGASRPPDSPAIAGGSFVFREVSAQT